MSSTNKNNNKLTEKYQKWALTEAKLVEETKIEEETEKQKSNEQLGIHTSKTIYSQDQANDKLKYDEIQNNIKKSLDEHQERERNAIATLDNLFPAVMPVDVDNNNVIEINEDMIGEKRVISLRNCNGPGSILFPNTLSTLTSTITTKEVASTSIQGIIKIFIENCTNCTIQIDCKIITSTIEITNCKNIIIEFLDAAINISTIQVDLCKDVILQFKNEYCFGYDKNKYDKNSYGDRIYHAGVSNMNIQIYKSNSKSIIMETNVDYIRDGAIPQQNATAEEYQFITYVDNNHEQNQLKTERLIRYKGMALSESQFKSRNSDTLEIDNNDDMLQEDMLKQCINHKLEGNQAFQDGNYAQAVLYYSLAIDKSSSKSNIQYTERHICYANRSACFLKLGEHEKALNDANECIALNKEYVKGKFRKGLALHAMGKYVDAMPLLVECLKHEPKNKQVKQALTFCEYRLDMERRKRNE